MTNGRFVRTLSGRTLVAAALAFHVQSGCAQESDPPPFSYMGFAPLMDAVTALKRADSMGAPLECMSLTPPVAGADGACLSAGARKGTVAADDSPSIALGINSKTKKVVYLTFTEPSTTRLTRASWMRHLAKLWGPPDLDDGTRAQWMRGDWLVQTDAKKGDFSVALSGILVSENLLENASKHGGEEKTR